MTQTCCLSAGSKTTNGNSENISLFPSNLLFHSLSCFLLVHFRVFFCLFSSSSSVYCWRVFSLSLFGTSPSCCSLSISSSSVESLLRRSLWVFLSLPLSLSLLPILPSISPFPRRRILWLSRACASCLYVCVYALCMGDYYTLSVSTICLPRHTLMSIRSEKALIALS